MQWNWLRDDIKGLAGRPCSVALLGVDGGDDDGWVLRQRGQPDQPLQLRARSSWRRASVDDVLLDRVGRAAAVSTRPTTGTVRASTILGRRRIRCPGGPVSTTVTVTNVGNDGTTTASLGRGALYAARRRTTRATWEQTRPGFCGKVDVTIANTTPGATDQCVYSRPLVGNCPAPSTRTHSPPCPRRR